MKLDELGRAESIGQLEEALIVPLFGFTDREDYYKQVESSHILKDIRVPTIIINSMDDPFFGHFRLKDPLPSSSEIGEAPVQMVVTNCGGHCGFFDYETYLDADCGYFQREIAKWFAFVRESRKS